MDTGCTSTLVHASLCRTWTPKRSVLVTMEEGRLECAGEAKVEVECQGRRATLDALVVTAQPLGMVDVLIGMDGIEALGGVEVRSPSLVTVGVAGGPRVAAARVGPAELRIKGPDFSGELGADGRWVVRWKWADGKPPAELRNETAQYRVPATARVAFDDELQEWVDQGWLVPYDEGEFGPVRALIPLMAVEQPHKGKVRPVLDFRQLNEYIPVHAAGADVCAEEVRKWRQHGVKLAVVDLKKAYLQLHVDRDLWPYQTVMVGGRRYCLGRLGFGLNVAPLIMKAVVDAVLGVDERMRRAVLAYVDDLLVDERVASADEVVAHFARYGLACKPPQRVTSDGVRALGLKVTPRQGGGLSWGRDNALLAPPAVTTRRTVFQWCGTLTAHLPVAGWLRPATAWLKRAVNEVTAGWDDPVQDSPRIAEMIASVHARVSADDPARGRWDFGGGSATVWTDASAIATGVVLTNDEGDVLEDACWLRSQRDSVSHINMSELDAAIKGLNLAVAWGVRTVTLCTDSAAVASWIRDAVSGRARLRSKARGELLIRRRLGIVAQLVEEFGLTLSIRLVTSAENVADALTRVPRHWLGELTPASPAADDDLVAAVATGVAGSCPVATHGQIAAVHAQTGHMGIRRTLWYARRELPGALVRRADVRAVVTTCDVCRSIDPAPTRWKRGVLTVSSDWTRLAIDLTHIGPTTYLSVIDCGPCRFALWRALRRGTGEEVVAALEQIFFERGAPCELLLDNATEFRGRVMRAFAARWRVVLRFRAAYEAGGNGVVERHHRTIKVIVARQRCSVQEAVHRYNVTPRKGAVSEQAPAALAYGRAVRDLPVVLASAPPVEEAASNEPRGGAEWRPGDRVWTRRRGLDRCGDRSKPGVVTGVPSDQVVEVDGVPIHVRNVRRRREESRRWRGLPAEGRERLDPRRVALDEEVIVDEVGSDGGEDDEVGGDSGGDELPVGQEDSGESEEDGEGPAQEDGNRFAVLADDDDGGDVCGRAPLRRSGRARRPPSTVHGTVSWDELGQVGYLRRPPRRKRR